ncbi:MAG TPA: sugar-transfer associated ATP-grasp domain-containing protein [Gemmatimonadales bacterium]|nr:sugar-transfer associated ATP-grasp domain-containing protein [Gemmatimonadales bacterium]
MNRLTAALLGLGFSDARLVTGIYRRLQLQNQPSRWAQLTFLPLEPWRALRRCAAYVRQHHRALREVHGKGPVRQFLSLLWADLRYGVSPGPFVSCFALGMTGRRKWDGYLCTAQVNTLLWSLARRSDGPLRAELGDKRTFPAWASRHGLKGPGLVAVFEAGRMTWCDERALPDCDLFAKPSNRYGGHGAMCLRRMAGGWSNGDDVNCDAEGLLARLCERSNQRPYVLQRRLAPHPTLHPFTTQAVPTVRAVTGIEPDGRARLLRASVRLPMAGSVVDNVTAGGMVAAVNLANGQLEGSVAWRPDGMVQYADIHPANGAVVRGFQLPEWHAVTRLAEQAQEAAPTLPLVGWDIALTAEGPLLLEANFAFATDIVTVPQRTPLGESGFCGILVRGWVGS